MPQEDNTNCLAGWRCPDCGNTAGFKVDVVRHNTVYLYDSGTEDKEYGDTDWESWSQAACGNCQLVGMVFDFTCHDAEKRRGFFLLIEKRKADQGRLDNCVSVAKESRMRGDLLEVGDAFMQLVDTNNRIETLNAS